MEKISENVYVETSFTGCNVGFIVTGSGVVMVDTPMIPEDAIKWRDEIAAYGPVRYLINSEPHLDHFAGNHFFDGTVIAHEGIRKAILPTTIDELKKRLNNIAPGSLSLLSGFSYRLPDITFSQNLTFYLGDHTFQILHMPGHTKFQTAVYIPQERVVFTSDNVFCRVQAVLSESLPFQWLDSLQQLQELEADIFVPGHGEICDRSYLPEMSAFIQDWIDAVSDAINKGISLEEARETIEFFDRYPMPPGSESSNKWLQHKNVERLYKVLKQTGTG
jgi:cyclase